MTKQTHLLNTGASHALSRFALAAVGVCLSMAMWSNSGTAAELQLRPQAMVAGGLVRLGDVAEILAAAPEEIERLTQVDLFPAPPSGRKRTLSARELNDILALRGENLSLHTFTGASQVQLLTMPSESSNATGGFLPSAGPALSWQREMHRRVEEAILAYLDLHAGRQPSRTVQVELTAEQIQEISTAQGKLQVSGGTEPWTGRQEFVVRTLSRTNDLLLANYPGRRPMEATASELSIVAQVQQGAAVVTSVRSLPKGATIQPGDVRLEPAPWLPDQATPLGSLEEAIGRETTKAIPVGHAVLSSELRQPLLVHRGEVVTVLSRAGGITVRTTGRAKEDGSLGDLISVESLTDRKAYFARVSGVQEVEITSGSATAGATNHVAPQVRP